MPKYLLIPGYIEGKDGQRHFICERMLMRLYNVHEDDCVVGWPHPNGQVTPDPHLIELKPRPDGNYTLPAF
jgi:hypothetical protein